MFQGDYTDHYHLLGYKALSSLYWIVRNCAHVPWTLHTDDDLLIDTIYMQTFMQDIKETREKRKFHCSVYWDDKVPRTGKWKVTKEEVNERTYPPFCQGAMWFISTTQVFKLLKASLSVNFLWLDDVYITGYLAQQARIGFSDIKEYVDIKVFDKYNVGKKLAWYQLQQDRTKLWPVILSHHSSANKKSPFHTIGKKGEWGVKTPRKGVTD